MILKAAVVFALFVVIIGLTRHLINYSKHWRAKTAHKTPVVHLTAQMAVRRTVLGHSVPTGYRLACLYFGSGLIDRTQTLDHGFPVKILDTVPSIPDQSLSPVTESEAISELSTLCGLRAEAIIQRAREESRIIRILWSGGIDSTAAACAILSKVDSQSDRVEICYSKQSVKEYKRYFKHNLKDHKLIKINDVTDTLSSDALIVTGEHGDQLFGSLKALTLDWNQLNQNWNRSFPLVLNTQLASSHRVDTLVQYLEPQIARSPVPIETLWDLLWWLNFSLKWQHVITRIPFSSATTDTSESTLKKQLSLTEHFFRTPQFEIWAIKNRQFSIKPGDWTTYKYPLKDYILKETGDEKYHRRKTKEASLQHVMSRSLMTKLMRTCIAIDATSSSFSQPRDFSLRNAISGFEAESESGVSVSYERHQEDDLWEALGDSGG